MLTLICIILGFVTYLLLGLLGAIFTAIDNRKDKNRW